MRFNTFLDYISNVNSLGFKDLVDLYCTQEITKDNKQVILGVVADSSLRYSEERVLSGRDNVSQRDLDNVSKLDMVFAHNQDLDVFKAILYKYELTYLYDFYPFIMSGDFKLSDYKELLTKRQYVTATTLSKSELPFLFLLHTEGEEEEEELLQFIENYYKSDIDNLGKGYFEIPNVSYFLNDLFYVRLIKLFKRNKATVKLLFSMKSIFNIQTRKCFDNEYPNKLYEDEYKIVMERILMILKIFKVVLKNDKEFKELPLYYLYSQLKNKSKYIYPTNHLNSSERLFLDYMRIPLGNFTNDIFELDSVENTFNRYLKTNETMKILFKTAYSHNDTHFKEYLNNCSQNGLPYLTNNKVLTP